MNIAELIRILQTFDPDQDAVLTVVGANGVLQLEEIKTVRDNDGHAQICSEEAEALIKASNS